MRSLTVAAMLLAFSAVAPAALAASEPAAPPNPNERICRTTAELGTRLNRQRLCLTRAEWEARRQEGRRSIDRAQTNQINLTVDEAIHN